MRKLVGRLLALSGVAWWSMFAYVQIKDRKELKVERESRNPLTNSLMNLTFPHKNPKVLHAPGQCEYCDMYSVWQSLRVRWGISFTGQEPTDTQPMGDPADIEFMIFEARRNSNPS